MHGDSLIARVHDTSLSVAGFAMRPAGVEPDLVTLDSVVVSGIEVRHPEQTAEIRRVLVAGTRIKAWINPAQHAQLADRVRAGGAAPATKPGRATAACTAKDSSARAAAAGTPTTPPWTMKLDELAIRDLGFDFEDRTTEPVFAVAAAPVNVTVRNISTRPDAVFDVQSDITIAEKGRVDVMGTVAGAATGGRPHAEARELAAPSDTALPQPDDEGAPGERHARR